MIALAILGVITTFTIPKVLNSQQNGKFKAIAKEDMSMVSAAYQQYVLTNRYNANICIKDFWKDPFIEVEKDPKTGKLWRVI